MNSLESQGITLKVTALSAGSEAPAHGQAWLDNSPWHGQQPTAGSGFVLVFQLQEIPSKIRGQRGDL